jgi:hypothetical protein
MVSWWYGNLMKCQVDEIVTYVMVSWWNGKLM